MFRDRGQVTFRFMNRVRRALAFSGILLFVSCTAQKHDSLIVGMELAYPPFEMTDERGMPAGVSVDLARALASHLDQTVRIENIPFDGLIPALKTGKIDCIISSMTATDERQRSIDFSEPYVFTGLAILAAKNRSIHQINDLNQAGRVVAVKLGTTGHVYAQQHITDAQVRVLKKENACVLEVIQGKADGFLYDQMSVYKNWNRHRETTDAILDPFKLEAWAMGFRKGDHTLRESANDFLVDFRKQGGFDELGKTYLADMKAAFSELGYPFVFDPIK